MTRQNYYQVHKNKKLRRSIKRRERWVNPAISLTTMITAMSALQIGAIMRQPIPLYASGTSVVSSAALKELATFKKKTEIAALTLGTFGKVVNELKKVKQYNFKQTGKYEK